MKTIPALRQAVSILCLALISIPAPALGKTPAHRHYRHRARVVQYVDPAKDDVVINDDPVVRNIAVDALGHEKGSVLAVDPTNGRILSIVNQKLAFSAGFAAFSAGFSAGFSGPETLGLSGGAAGFA